MSAATALFATLVFTISAIYRVNEAGLTALELVLVGTALESSAFIGEVPTGVVADVYSRRLSIVIGVVLLGCAFLIEGSFALFPAILAAQVVSGFGYTFLSGATEAWVTDELRRPDMTHVFVRAAQAGQVAGLAGMAGSVALASVHLRLPYLVAGCLTLALGVFLILAMPETGFAPAPREERSSWQNMGHTFAGGLGMIGRRPVLITILAIGAIYGMASESFDRLWELHFLRDFSFPSLGDLDPIVWFGIINAGSMIVSIAVLEAVRRRVNTATHRTAAWALLLVNALLIASMVTFGLAGNFGLAVGTFGMARLMRRINAPIYLAWMNQGLDPGVRATVLSMGGQADALGQIVGGPVFGVIAKAVSVRAALVAAGGVLLPALFLYGRTLRGADPDAMADQMPSLVSEATTDI